MARTNTARPASVKLPESMAQVEDFLKEQHVILIEGNALSFEIRHMEARLSEMKERQKVLLEKYAKLQPEIEGLAAALK